MTSQIMPRDVVTRWNSTFNMLEFALEYQAAIRAIVGNDELGLDKYGLTAQEWRIAKQPCEVLQVNYILHREPNHRSEFADFPSFSKSPSAYRFSRTQPCSSLVVPPIWQQSFLQWITSMDHINECLTTDRLNMRYNMVIRASLGIVKKTLQPISLTCRSSFFSVHTPDPLEKLR
jgi:hypothetical protein